MRETHTAQSSIFDFYSNHEIGLHLSLISDYLDAHRDVLGIIFPDLASEPMINRGRRGLSAESVLRCLILKQLMGFSYDKMAFHLSDSPTFSTFCRTNDGEPPSRSTLQENIRRISPESLESVFDSLAKHGLLEGNISLEAVRIDSTFVDSHIAPPSDSSLLEDCVRVLCRQMGKSRDKTGIKVRFCDRRAEAKRLAYQIFDGKKLKKEALYPELCQLARYVVNEAECALDIVEGQYVEGSPAESWWFSLEHYIELAHQVIDQTERRVIHNEKVPSSEKIVSIFEPHTDILVKKSSRREVQYGHKINVSTDGSGLLTHIGIERGNPADCACFLPILEAHQQRFEALPKATVADGCYASQDNAQEARNQGVKRVVFHKKCGLTLSAMGVKQKTFDALKKFRAGVEGNISHLKRGFGLRRAMWKKREGFEAYVFASAIAYNVSKLACLALE